MAKSIEAPAVADKETPTASSCSNPCGSAQSAKSSVQAVNAVARRAKAYNAIFFYKLSQNSFPYSSVIPVR